MKLKILNLSNLFIYKLMNARHISPKYLKTKCVFYDLLSDGNLIIEAQSPVE